MPEAPLTAKQQAIFDYIRTQIEDRGYPPAIRDICRAFGISSPNGVMCHLRALQTKGYINRVEKDSDLNQRSQARGITIPGVNAGGASLPFLGQVAAGQAIEAIPTSNERLDLKEMLVADNHFILQVRGESMIESHIQDGDFVVIRKQETAENGEKVVAMIDNDVTLKKFYKRKDHIKLEPANGTMAPIIVDPEKQNVSVLGVLVGVVRKC